MGFDMILMAVNRIKDKRGRYTDEEKSRHRFEYLYDYSSAGFRKSGKAGFKKSLLSELNRLKKEGLMEMCFLRYLLNIVTNTRLYKTRLNYIMTYSIRQRLFPRK